MAARIVILEPKYSAQNFQKHLRFTLGNLRFTLGELRFTLGIERSLSNGGDPSRGYVFLCDKLASLQKCVADFVA